MNTIEKAKDLISKMKKHQCPNDLDFIMAKASAKTAVDEIIELLNDWRMEKEIIQWWEDVKQQIELS